MTWIIAMLNMIATIIGDSSEPKALITDYQNLEEFLEFVNK